MTDLQKQDTPLTQDYERQVSGPLACNPLLTQHSCSLLIKSLPQVDHPLTMRLYLLLSLPDGCTPLGCTACTPQMW
jgi:hypothetical protein